MNAPDRIWAASGGEQYRDGYWTTNDVPDEGYTEYARLTPELLALIEAAKAWDTQYPRYVGAGTKVLIAAFAFAKSQDHPDAG